MNLHNAQRQFAMKLARLKYITHLEADADTGPCPICQSEDENRVWQFVVYTKKNIFPCIYIFI